MTKMPADQIQAVAFEIIISAGDGRTKVHEAIQEMRKGNFTEAEAILEDANESFVTAHKAQTSMLQEYAGGTEITMEIIFVHAQDHLMTGMLYKDMAEDMLELYKRLDAIE